MDQIEITLNDKKIKCKKGITLYELAKDYQSEYDNDILLANVDGMIKELYHTVKDNNNIKFLTYADSAGKKAYARGITMIVLKSLYKIIPKEEFKGVTVEFSLDTGVYCKLVNEIEITDELLASIEERMKKYVGDDVPFDKKTMSTNEAISLFEQRNMPDKCNLIKYRRSSKVNVYSLGKVKDYFYGPMPYSTGALKYFKLQKFDDGFVFIIPTINEPKVVPGFNPSMKLYKTLKESNDWAIKLKKENVGRLNDIIVNGDLREMILVEEALHEKKIAQIATEIANQGNVKVVTIAGPSSSGKTTFSYRLSAQLKTLGLRPHPIALDDYFVNRVDTPKDENGKYNYECIEAIDTKQINADLAALLAGESVQIPTYNFITGVREYDKPTMKLESDEILVIEGIHGLNDLLTKDIAPENKFRIYISALTTLNIDDHNRISTSDGRLLRRIVRDARTRGHSAQRTIDMWRSVRNGENINIFPFQEKADAMFNSSLVYEISALKTYAEPLLYRVPRDSVEYPEAQRLLKFLDYFLAINPEEIPLNSIVREFIGGGILLD